MPELAEGGQDAGWHSEFYGARKVIYDVGPALAGKRPGQMLNLYLPKKPLPG